MPTVPDETTIDVPCEDPDPGPEIAKEPGDPEVEAAIAVPLGGRPGGPGQDPETAGSVRLTERRGKRERKKDCHRLGRHFSAVRLHSFAYYYCTSGSAKSHFVFYMNFYIFIDFSLQHDSLGRPLVKTCCRGGHL